MASIPQHRRTLTIDPYVLAGPWPQRAPVAGGFSATAGFAGANSATTGLVAPLSVDPGAGVYSRWIADPAKFVDAGDGTTHWSPSAGASLVPYWQFNNPNLPAVQTDYSYKRYRGDEVVTPAVVFNSNHWATLRSFPVNRGDFSVLMVARLIRTHKTATGGILESVVYGSDPNARRSDVWLRLDGDYLRSGCLGRHVTQWIHQTGRPQMFGMSHFTRSSRQILVDDQRRHVDYTHHYNYWGYDTTMLLGRTAGAYDVDRTIHMDLLEIVMWEGAITLHQMYEAIHQLNAVYGIFR